MIDLNSLNKEQREAVVSTEGPLLILAGAGSGKTRVLTFRIAYLIQQKEVFPSNILAITFTNKASKEMRERVEELVGSESGNMWISTFHSSCVRMLRQDADKIGYNKNFVIYDTSDQEKVMKECLKELNLDEKVFPVKEMLSKIGSQKDILMDEDTYYRMNANDFKNRRVAEVYSLYQKKLKGNNALDFDDIIMKSVKLLRENPEVLAYYQRKFRYIMIDEYQDTNRAQYEFVKLLSSSHKNLCVVGDDDQSIYGWRGADIKNILDFEKDYPNAKVIKLEQNYRCTKRILDAANYVIANNEKRKAKRLWTENKTGENIKLFRGDTDRDEARYIVGQIDKLAREGYSYRDFAILYRTNAMSRIIEEGFVTSHLPYRVVGGLKFYDRREVKDVLAYLKVINNPLDSVSLERIVNVPKRGIGDSSVARVKEYGLQRDMGLYSTMLELEHIDGLTKRAANSLEKFISLMNYFMLAKEKMKVSELINEILEKTEYVKGLKEENTPESESRIENLKEFYSAAVEFEETGGEKSLSAFLEKVALVSDQDQLDDVGGVTMMTMHTAKGLEFPVVFIAGVEEGIFPHFSALEDPEELEEERRLCYVGITRAKETLYLTCARQRLMFGRTMFNEVSSFVEEIPEDLIEDVSPKRANFNRVYDYDGGLSSQQRQSRHINTPVSSYTAPTASTGSVKPTEIKAGVKIVHKVFGKGIVIALKPSGGDTQLTVHFDNAGLKSLLLSSAPIEII